MAKLFDTTQTITIHCKIVAIEDGQYTAIVVEDLNRIETDDLEIYKYTNNYFISFIKEKDICNQKEFNF